MANNHLKFSSYWLPSAEQGNYKITANQSAVTNVTDNYTTSMNFIVATNRFYLPDSEIYSVYPPKNSHGQYENTLPHIVLKNPQYPWECSASASLLTPWTTLLLIDELDDATISHLTVRNALAPPKNIYTPHVELNKLEHYDDYCYVVDLEKTLFQKIMPPTDNLPFMAHIRTVSHDNKVTDSSLYSQSSACILSNRTTMAPRADHEINETKHTGLLVSLIGFESESQTDKSLNHSDYTHVRMIVLHHFSFYVVSSPYNFHDICNSLKVGTVKHNSSCSGDRKLKNIIDSGYIPMNHDLRGGSDTVSWYRGPLVPLKLNRQDKELTKFADSKLIYDPDMAMFDTSYAAAWQLGRMLSIQNPIMTKILMEMRIEKKHKAARLSNRKVQKKLFKSSSASDISNTVKNIDNDVDKILFTDFSGTGHENFLKKVDAKILTDVNSTSLSQLDILKLIKEEGDL